MKTYTVQVCGDGGKGAYSSVEILSSLAEFVVVLHRLKE